MEVGIWMMIIFILKIMKSKQYIRKLIREELNKPIVNKSFSLTMDDVEYIFEDWDLELLDEEERQRLKGHIIRFLQTNFSLDEKGMLKGIENFPEKITLYRLIFANHYDKINTDNLGIHWTINKNTIYDDKFWGQIGFTFDESDGSLYIIKAVFKKSQVDAINTTIHQLSNEIENEITIKRNEKPIVYKIFNY